MPHATGGFCRQVDGETLRSPFKDYLITLHARISGLSAGDVADYIPELAKARPEAFAISFATIDGQVYSVGDADETFTIQSVSKPFAYGTALERLGLETVLTKVGVEPTGEAFNSIILDEANNRPFNPMVNAGAIAIAALAQGSALPEKIEKMRASFSAYAGHDLEIDEAVYLSESDTGRRNRAIAWLMLNTDMFEGEVDQVLDLYFRQCALKVTCADLALMGATLANNGVNPVSRRRLLSPETVRDVLTVMMTCGMYDYAGEWSYEVGLPAKSGVSGSILAILPGQLSIAVWSPPIDRIGNSVRGVEVCKQISKDFGLHLFMNAASVEDVIRRESRSSRQSSLRIRNPRERELLARDGHRIALIELQGALYFASTERLVRRIGEIVGDVDYLILDFRRLGSMDAAALTFFKELFRRTKAQGIDVSFTSLDDSGCDAAVEELRALAKEEGAYLDKTADDALEAFEEMLLEKVREPYDNTRFALHRLDIFKGLDDRQLAMVERVLRPMQFEAGQRILSAGSRGRMFFVIARGSVSIFVKGSSGAQMRISCIGPGQFFGEMSVLQDGARSADVIADERVICYGMTGDDLDAFGSEDPKLLAVILANMGREFATRLRRANELISDRS